MDRISATTTHFGLRHGTVFVLALAFFHAGPSHIACGGDWPQILGPNRNGQAQEERLADNWPAGFPKKAWQYELGSGYAGPAVWKDRVLVFHRVDDRERLDCVGAQDGQRLWQADWPASYRGGIDPDLGPRCVPLVHDRRVFVFGAAGDLHCVQLNSGSKLWSRELANEYSADEGYFGTGSTPIVVANRLIINVGGQGATGIVALDPENGKTLWTSTTEGASYSSPIAYKDEGESRALFATRLNAVGIRPTKGEVVFRLPFGQRGPTVNAATPIMVDEHLVFLTASYRIGAVLLQIDGKQTETVWSSDDVMSSQYPTPIHHAGYLYGIHGREDGPPAELRCVHARSGKVMWKKVAFGMANLILADNKLLVLRTDGRLLLLAPTPQEYRQLATAQISRSTTRALPAVSKGRLFFRENSGDRGLLVSLALGE